ncbi:hypothetical protein QAD02_011018 [Eretmocerus hayati]|uniref:Uncharacterized protein n=1 Tax=Eretmocerus hayati TaxID=131215 RepID=A0ACC2NVR9_9HYME|nr:hypothetical protein QAD02_011018 [Eretmocerus hayati]
MDIRREQFGVEEVKRYFSNKEDDDTKNFISKECKKVSLNKNWLKMRHRIVDGKIFTFVLWYIDDQLIFLRAGAVLIPVRRSRSMDVPVLAKRMMVLQDRMIPELPLNENEAISGLNVDPQDLDIHRLRDVDTLIPNCKVASLHQNSSFFQYIWGTAVELFFENFINSYFDEDSVILGAQEDIDSASDIEREISETEINGLWEHAVVHSGMEQKIKKSQNICSTMEGAMM